MQSYIVAAKIPRKANAYLREFKSRFLKMCLERDWECVVNYLSGRIIIFCSADPCRDIEKMRNVVYCKRVRIFRVEEFEDLISTILKLLRDGNCRSFAIRSNKKDVEIKLGEKILEHLDIKVDLENPHCEINVEKRGKFYLLMG